MCVALFLLFLVTPPAAPATFNDLFRAGLIALQNGELINAQSSLTAAAKLEPNNGRVWVALSQTFWRLHDVSQAEQAAAKALDLAPADPAVLQSLVIYYTESARPLKAAEAQSVYASLHPSDRQAAERAASLYFEGAQPLLEREQFAQAVSVLQSAVAKTGANAQLQLALGVACYGLRRYDEAAQAFLATIALDPTIRQPYQFLGKMLEQIVGRLPEVTRRFAELERANPSDGEAYLLHAKALDAQNVEAEKARILLAKSIALNETDASAHFELGTLLERVREFPRAAGEFERASVLDPANAATHYHLSRLYDRLGKVEAAAAEREQHRKLIAAQSANR